MTYNFFTLASITHLFFSFIVSITLIFFSVILVSILVFSFFTVIFYLFECYHGLSNFANFLIVLSAFISPIVPFLIFIIWITINFWGLHHFFKPIYIWFEFRLLVRSPSKSFGLAFEVALAFYLPTSFSIIWFPKRIDEAMCPLGLN